MADGHTCETATAPIDQNDETAIQGVAATPAAQRPGSSPPALGEYHRQLIDFRIILG